MEEWVTDSSPHPLRYVGKISRKESESSEEFGARVQAATASALNLNTSNHTVADKVCTDGITFTLICI